MNRSGRAVEEWRGGMGGGEEEDVVETEEI
jgi:hypothetical protein